MKEPRASVLGGLLSLGGLLVVAALVLALARPGAMWLWSGGQTLSVQLDSAPGLRPGCPVTVSGISVGTVRRVTLADAESLTGGVVAEVLVRGHAALRRGSRAQVVPSGVTGRATVELIPGPADQPPLDAGGVIRGELAGGASALMPASLAWALERSAERIGAAADALAPVLSHAERLVAPKSTSTVDGGSDGNVASTFARLDTALRNFNEVFGDDQARRKLRESLDNFQAVSADSRALLADAKAVFASARTIIAGSEQVMTDSRAALSSVSRRVDDSSEKLNRALELAVNILTQLEPIAAKVGRGEGTLGRLATDDRVYEALLLTLRRAGDPR